LLASHRWPGNVRELKNTLARALAFIDGDELRPEHVALDAAADRATTTLERLPLRGHTLESVERAVIKQALDASAGDQEKASRSLGITVAALREKMRRYGLSTG
jgi:DNA-binding NtrC family response regulator